EHEPRFLPHGDDARTLAVAILRKGDDGGFGEHDALPSDIHDDVGGAQVDADLLGKHLRYSLNARLRGRVALRASCQVVGRAPLTCGTKRPTIFVLESAHTTT